MGRITRRPLAGQDLVDVWTYIAAEDESAADAVLDRIEGALVMLADRPQAGRARPELMNDLRSFPVGRSVLFYLPRAGGIELVRVLSHYRDIGADTFEI